jgi:hypothetical protein
MHTQGNDRRGDRVPAIVTAIVAVVGTAGVVLIEFGPGDGSKGSDNARIFTAAAVARAAQSRFRPSRWPTGREPKHRNAAILAVTQPFYSRREEAVTGLLAPLCRPSDSIFQRRLRFFSCY